MTDKKTYRLEHVQEWSRESGAFQDDLGDVISQIWLTKRQNWFVNQV